MTKTQELIALIEAGTHRISPHTQTHVEKWRGQPYGWTTVGGWRVDVVRRVAFHFYRKAKEQA
jgi:hypothetical protein